MKQVRLKVAYDDGWVTIPAGEVLEELSLLDEQVQSLWPGIEERVFDKMVAVQLPHLDYPSLLSEDLLERLDEKSLRLRQH